ncbi:MAG: nucleoside hydrolase [Armatimonadetes bacterium]|nr:nucleoside hydrolase [Armatimonadota bacterium]
MDRRPIPILIDTDIGEDLDDLLMLAVALNSPEFEVLAVTCVDGDTQARSRIARRVIAAFGQPQVPVVAGYSRRIPHGNGPVAPLLAITQNEVAPTEEGLPPACPETADALIARLAAERPGEIYLVSIGAVTNAGQTLVRHPQAARDLKAIVTLNVLTVPPGEPFHDWNFNYDPAAVALLNASEASWRLVSWDICPGLGPSLAEEEQIRRRGLDTTQVIATAIDAWRRNKREIRPETPPHAADLKALAYLLCEDQAITTRVRVNVTVGTKAGAGVLQVEADPEGSRVAVWAIPAERGEPLRRLFLERLLADPQARKPAAAPAPDS